MKHIVYHGTNNKFNQFDLDRSTNGIIWFTGNIDTIKDNVHGGEGSNYILKCEITIDNPAGWDEYDKYSIGELINEGFDGVILEDDGVTDYIVFEVSQIKILDYSVLSETRLIIKRILKERTFKTMSPEHRGAYGFGDYGEKVLPHYLDKLDEIQKYVDSKIISHLNKGVASDVYELENGNVLKVGNETSDLMFLYEVFDNPSEYTVKIFDIQEVVINKKILFLVEMETLTDFGKFCNGRENCSELDQLQNLVQDYYDNDFINDMHIYNVGKNKKGNWVVADARILS